jgi:hypothetical protein
MAFEPLGLQAPEGIPRLTLSREDIARIKSTVGWANADYFEIKK